LSDIRQHQTLKKFHFTNPVILIWKYSLPDPEPYLARIGHNQVGINNITGLLIYLRF